MYANSLQYLFRKFINWEQKGNIKVITVEFEELYYAITVICSA